MRHNNYGCLPPIKDVRDYKLKKAVCAGGLPSIFRLENLPRVKNQGSVSSCVAHASSSILEYHAKLDCGEKVDLSTSFIYGIQKKLFDRDGAGMYLRHACKIVSTYGDMLEEDCPGNKEVPVAHTIAENAMSNNDKVERAANYKVQSYVKLNNNDAIKRAIMNYGPVLASIKWYDTFKCDDQDVLRGEQTGDYGYHAIMLCGWCDEGFVAQNSWGKGYGNGGRFILPYEITVREAWQWIDAESDDIVKPSRNNFLDVIYKIINYIINFFNRK
jgi:C1A family cysteine protease